MEKEEIKIAKELSQMEREPLLPVEKKLISYSILIGLILLGVLYLISKTFFSV